MGASGRGNAAVDRTIVSIVARDRSSFDALPLIATRLACAAVAWATSLAVAIGVGAIHHAVAIVVGGVIAELGRGNAVGGAKAGLAVARVAGFDKAIRGATVFGVGVAVVASLTDFNGPISADRGPTLVGANFLFAADRVSASRHRAIIGTIFIERAYRVAAHRLTSAPAVVSAVFRGIASSVAASRFPAIIGAIFAGSALAVAADRQFHFTFGKAILSMKRKAGCPKKAGE